MPPLASMRPGAVFRRAAAPGLFLLTLWPAGPASVFVWTGAFAFPAGSKDAALLIALPPSAYTAVLGGVGGASGETPVEIYEVP